MEDLQLHQQRMSCAFRHPPVIQSTHRVMIELWYQTVRSNIHLTMNNPIYKSSLGLEVIDLNTQQIISSLTQATSRKVVPNPFNRSMAICYGSAIEILDKDMLVVQTMTYEWLSNLGMLDEFTIAAIPYANGMVLYDIRKLDAKNREVFISDATYRFSVDVRNQRLLAECDPHKIIAQVDWKTRRWERVWKPMTYGVFPVLHDNYMITSHPYKSQIIGYDFSK